MAHLILGEHPDGLTVRLVHGDGMTLAATLTDDTGTEIDWPAAPSLEFAGPEQDTIATHAATIDGPVASWSLTRAQVDTIWTASATRFAGPSTYVRALLPDGDNGSVEYAGKVAWSDGWTAGTQLQVKTFTRPIPVPGSGGGGGSDSLTIVNGGTVTLDDTKAEGSLVGYRVKASTEFSAPAGNVTLEPGAYTFERTADGWTYYAAEGVALVPPIPEPTWTPLATDNFTAADNTALIGRTTTTGALTYTDKEGSSPDIRIRGNRATFEAFSYGNTVRLQLGADHATGLRVSMDYEFYGVAPQVGSLSVLAGTEWTPHSAGFVLDQNGDLALAGSVPPKNFSGAATGHPKTGRFVVEWRLDGSVHALIGSTEVATAVMDSPLKGQLVDIGFGSNAAAIDNLLIEAIA